jgi:Pyridoxamine 5'-phosphate oxidase
MSNEVKMDHPDAQELLTSAPLLRLAYAGRDGLPRVIPIGFHWDGEQIFVCTAPSAPKVTALTERPNVALTIDTGITPGEAKQLLIRGVAGIEVVDGVPPEYIAGSTKTLSGTDLQEFETQVRGMYDQMARISITPRWARFYDFGTGRLPPFLRKLAEANHHSA